MPSSTSSRRSKQKGHGTTQRLALLSPSPTPGAPSLLEPLKSKLGFLGCCNISRLLGPCQQPLNRATMGGIDGAERQSIEQLLTHGMRPAGHVELTMEKNGK